MLLQRVRRVTVAAAKHLYVGLVCVSCSAAPCDIDAILRRARASTNTTIPATISADIPMPGHPERLVPNEPLTRVERQLWRQLMS